MKDIAYFHSRVLSTIATLASMIVLWTPGHAEDVYPSKPIRMVMCCVGAIDSVARVVAEVMSQDLG